MEKVKRYLFDKIMAEISEETGINRQALYKMFSKSGNPTLHSIAKLLDALGLELAVRPQTESLKKSS